MIKNIIMLIFVLFIGCSTTIPTIKTSESNEDKKHSTDIIAQIIDYNDMQKSIESNEIVIDSITHELDTLYSMISLIKISDNEIEKDSTDRFEIISSEYSEKYTLKLNKNNGNAYYLYKNKENLHWRNIRREVSEKDSTIKSLSNYTLYFPKNNAAFIMLLNNITGITWQLVRKEEEYYFKLIKED